MPLYTVRIKDQTEADPKETRLVRAKNEAQVRKHLVEAFEIERASDDEIAELCTAGVKVEQAKEAE